MSEGHRDLSFLNKVLCKVKTGMQWSWSAVTEVRLPPPLGCEVELGQWWSWFVVTTPLPHPGSTKCGSWEDWQIVDCGSGADQCQLPTPWSTKCGYGEDWQNCWLWIINHLPPPQNSKMWISGRLTKLLIVNHQSLILSPPPLQISQPF